MRLRIAGAFAAALLATSACEISSTGNQASDGANQAAQSAPAADPYASSPEAIERALRLAAAQGSEAERARLRGQARGEFRDLRVVVDLSDRQLRLFSGDRLMEAHPVAVGSKQWPTPTGSWDFHRVDINPEWIPPNESWAKEETRKAPGDPDNPMGRVRLVYRMPNTVHGTDDLDSLGKPVSHGSIRVANEVALKLAETFLRAGGAWEGPQWFQRMTEDRATEYQVDLANPIPIEVQE